MKVADFGAGSGAYVAAIADALEGTGVVYAIDIQRDLLRRMSNDAKHAGRTNVEIVWGDLETPNATKLADRHLDLVLISNLLFQLADKKEALREAKRVLKPGGTLVIIDWSESFGGMGPQPKAVVSKEAACALAKNAGFELKGEFDAGAHHYGVSFTVPEGFRAR